jgi:hypothetical protein
MMVGGAVIGGGSSIISSVMGGDKQNAQQMQRQRSLQIQQNNVISNMISQSTNIRNTQQDINQKTRVQLTNVERQAMAGMAKHVASKATSGTAGSSALMAYTNFMTQKMITKGNVISGAESEQIKLGKDAQNMAREAQSKMGALQSKISQAQSDKKSGTEMAIEATIAGIKGGMSGASAGASLGKSMKVGSAGGGGTPMTTKGLSTMSADGAGMNSTSLFDQMQGMDTFANQLQGSSYLSR